MRNSCVVRRHHKDGAEQAMEPFAQSAPVPGVTDGYLCMPIDEVRDSSGVMRQGVTEQVGTQSTLGVHAGVELETVVFTLPVVAGAGVASGCFMELAPEQSTHLNDGAVHEAQLGIMNEQAAEQTVQHRD